MSSTVQLRWRKASLSSGNQGCVELEPSKTRVRDSKNPEGPILRGDVSALVAAVKDGSFGS